MHFDPAALKQLEKIEHLKLDVRAWLRRELAVSGISVAMDIMNAAISTISCIMYFAQQYMDPNSDKYHTMDMVDNNILSIYFVLDLMLRAFVAPNLAFLWESRTLIDVITLVPCALSFTHSKGGGGFLVSALRLLRALRLVRIHRLAHYFRTEVAQHTFKMLLGIVILLVLSAGSVHLCETTDPFAKKYYEENYTDGIIPFHDVIYFVIVSITTVGYGDISPRSQYSKVIVIFMIIIMFGWLPSQTNKLAHLLSLQSEYARKAVRYRDHIVICGDITSGHELGSLLGELFHPDHGDQALFKQAVILSKNFPETDVRSVMGEPQFENVVAYLEGNSMDEQDLARASIEHADVVFIIIDKVAADSDNSDALTMLNAMAIKRYVKMKVGRSIPIYMQLIKPENRENFMGWLDMFNKGSTGNDALSRPGRKTADQIICVEDIKMNAMAKTTVAPAICTFISNLVACAFDSNDSGKAENAPNRAWEIEYLSGASYEMYDVKLDSSFSRRKFAEAASEVFAKTGVTLFALQIQPPGMEARVVLNPDTRIPDCQACVVHGFVLAQDSDEANTIENCLAPVEEPVAGRRVSKMQSFGRKGSQGKLSAKVSAAASGDAVTDVTMVEAVKFNVFKKAGQSVIKAQELIVQQKGVGSVHAAARAIHRANKWDFLRDPAAQDAAFGMLKMYHLNQEPSVFEDVSFSSYHEMAPALKGRDFVLLCGDLANLYYVMLPLRAVHLRIAPVVVLHPEAISAAVWNKLKYFPELYFVDGSPLDPEDLTRVGVRNASSAIVLAGLRTVVQAEKMEAASKHTDKREAMLDSDTIFAFQTITSQNPLCNVVVEMMDVGNIPFLTTSQEDTKFRHKSDYYLDEAFAAGQVYNYAVLDKMLVNTYFGEKLTTVVFQLIVGEDPVCAARWNHQYKTLNKQEEINESHLYQIPVPQECVGMTYTQVFTHLATTGGTVPLGIVRGVRLDSGVGTKGNAQSYLYTNPEQSAVLESCDSLFVLCTNQPDMTKLKKNTPTLAPAYSQRPRRMSSMEGHVRAMHTIDQLNRTLDRQASAPSDDETAQEFRAEVLQVLQGGGFPSGKSGESPAISVDAADGAGAAPQDDDCQDLLEGMGVSALDADTPAKTEPVVGDFGSPDPTFQVSKSRRTMKSGDTATLMAQLSSLDQKFTVAQQGHQAMVQQMQANHDKQMQAVRSDYDNLRTLMLSMKGGAPSPSRADRGSVTAAHI